MSKWINIHYFIPLWLKKAKAHKIYLTYEIFHYPPPFSSLDKCVGIIKQFIHEIVMLVVAMYALNPRAVI